jgi:glycosyltransferase involved in cell wall biosynthesis
MRTLHVIASANPKGGGPIEGLRRLNTALDGLDHTIEVLSLDAPGSPFLAELTPLCVHAIGSGKPGYGYTPNLKPWLEAHAGEYDAVFIRGLWQYSSYGTWQVMSHKKTPYFVFPHGMLDPWFKRTYPLKHLKKSLYWPWADYRVLRDARAVLFTCEDEKLLARESFKLYRCNEVVVRYGTSAPSGNPEAQRALFLKRYPELTGKRLVLYLSRIHEKKGCDLLIDAFAACASQTPDLRLVMAGPDQTGLQATLEEQAKRLGVADRITWTGMLSGDLKYGAIHASEVFALPSHQENFGIAVAEALACGLPVLISDKVNIWREIEADGAGLVGPDTAEGTRSTLAKWLVLSAGERQTMRERAARCFADRFDIRRSAEQLTEIVAAATK